MKTKHSMKSKTVSQDIRTDFVGVAEEITNLVGSLGIGSDVPPARKKALVRAISGAPVELLIQLAHAAEMNNGTIAGLEVDPAALRADVARIEAQRRLATVLRLAAERVENDALETHGTLAEQAITQLILLDGWVRTKEGKAFGVVQRQLRSVRRAATAKRRRRPIATPDAATAEKEAPLVNPGP